MSAVEAFFAGFAVAWVLWPVFDIWKEKCLAERTARHRQRELDALLPPRSTRKPPPPPDPPPARRSKPLLRIVR